MYISQCLCYIKDNNSKPIVYLFRLDFSYFISIDLRKEKGWDRDAHDTFQGSIFGFSAYKSRYFFTHLQS